MANENLTFPSTSWRMKLSLSKENILPVPVAAPSKVYGRSPAEIVDSNPTGGMDVCLLWALCVVR